MEAVEMVPAVVGPVGADLAAAQVEPGLVDLELALAAEAEAGEAAPAAAKVEDHKRISRNPTPCNVREWAA